MNQKKVCMVSSTGGHFMELIQLIPALNDINFILLQKKIHLQFKLLNNIPTTI